MRFRASGIPRVMKCFGSYLLEATHPRKSDQTAANEGNVAHKYASEILDGKTALETIPDLEMFAAVSVYVQTCNKYKLSGAKQGAEESHVVEIGGRTLSGTTDYFAWSPAGSLVIVDFKYGRGWVEVKENWQLICYAILMWLKYGMNGALPDKVRLVVVQPRANHPDGPIRHWDFGGSMLPKYLQDITDMMGMASLVGAKTISGLHCRHCKAVVDCHTNREACAFLVDVAMAGAQSVLSGEELAHENNVLKYAADMIKHRLTALETLTLERIKHGEIVPGYVVQQSYTALSWDVPDPISAGRDIDIDLAQETKPVTPTQAIDRKLLTSEQVNFMASRKLGAFKLKKQNLNFAKELINNVR